MMSSMATAADIVNALRSVMDPELGLNLVDLGLVYGIDIADARARIVLTMTSPACPLSEYLKQSIDQAVRAQVPALREVAVSIVWDPPWSPEMLSADARRELDPDA
jgi:metal-sulfur cluster biosynthetic enzyme